MQIYEIMQKQPVNEIGIPNAVKNLSQKVVQKYPGLSDQAIMAKAANVGQAINRAGTAVGNAVGTAATGVKNAVTPYANLIGKGLNAASNQYIKSKTGVDVAAQTRPAGSPYGTARAGAASMNEPLIAQQAKSQMALWYKSLQTLMQQQGVSAPGQLNPASKQEMKRNLWNQLHKNFMQGLVGNNYTQLKKYVDRQAQAEAAQISDNIKVALAPILDLENPLPDPQTQLQQWTSLAKAAYQAMSLAQFRPAKSVYDWSPESEAKRQATIAMLKQKLLQPMLAQDAKEKIVSQLKLLQNPPQTAADLNLGGQPLNPNDPTDAQILALLRAQGKIQ
jgi:hypothetical protein